MSDPLIRAYSVCLVITNRILAAGAFFISTICVTMTQICGRFSLASKDIWLAKPFFDGKAGFADLSFLDRISIE